MTASVPLRRAGLALALLAAGCNTQTVVTPTRSLDRPSDTALVCASINDSGEIVTHPLGHCAPGCLYQPKDYARLYLLVTNTTRGEVALVSAGSLNPGAIDAGEPLNGDAGAGIVDIDPTNPGYGFLPVGSLPDPVRVSDDGCLGVTANQGDCTLSSIDVSTLIQVPACLEPDVGNLNPACRDSKAAMLSRVTHPIYPYVDRPAGPEFLGARPTWVELLPANEYSSDGGNGCPSESPRACSSTEPRRALVAFPTCQLVAEIQLGTSKEGKILRAVRLTSSGPVDVADLNTLRCAADCRDQPAAPALDLSAGVEEPDSDAGDAPPTDGGLPPIFPSVLPYPHTLALDRADPSTVRGVWVADAVGATVTFLPYAGEGLTAAGAIERRLDGTVGGVSRLRLSDPVVDLTYCVDGNGDGRPCPEGAAGITPRYLYAIGRDRSVRVLEVLAGVGNPAPQECETNPDPTLLQAWLAPRLPAATQDIRNLPSNVDIAGNQDDFQTRLIVDFRQPSAAWHTPRLLHCVPVNDALRPRAAQVNSPGITLPTGGLPRDVAFTRITTPPVAVSGSAAPSAAPGVLLGTFAWIIDSTGRTYGTNIADLCPQPNIIPGDQGYAYVQACAPQPVDDTLLKNRLTVGGFANYATSAQSSPWYSQGLATRPVPPPIAITDLLPNRLRSGVLRYIQPGNFASTTDTNGGPRLAGNPQLAGATTVTTDEKSPRLCDLDGQTCAPPVQATANLSPRPLIDFRDTPLFATESWILAWEGELPGTARSTGTVSFDQAGNFTGLVDESATLCTQGVRPGDKLLLKGCIADSDCGIDQGCWHDPQAPTYGLCLDDVPVGNLEAARRQQALCKPWATGILRYRIVEARQGRLKLAELYEPEHPADTHDCTGDSDCADIQVRVPTSSGALAPRATSCVSVVDATGATSRQCLLKCDRQSGDVLSTICGPGYQCVVRQADATSLCMRAPLPTAPECFREQQIYSVLGGEAFVAAGGNTGFLRNDRPGPDGVCQPGDDSGVARFMSGRIPLVFERPDDPANPGRTDSTLFGYSRTPLCSAAISSAWRSASVAGSPSTCQLPPPAPISSCATSSDCNKDPTTGNSVQRALYCKQGKCSPIDCTRDEDCSKDPLTGAAQVTGLYCYAGRCDSAARLHYDNPWFTFAVDVPALCVDGNGQVATSPGCATGRTTPPPRVSRVPDDGATLSLQVVGGFRALAYPLGLGDVPAQLPRTVVTAPDLRTLYVVDEGRQQAGTGLRGQVVRFFTDSQSNDGRFVVR